MHRRKHATVVVSNQEKIGGIVSSTPNPDMFRDIVILLIVLALVIFITSLIDPGTMISLGIGILTGSIAHGVMKKRKLLPWIR